MVSLLMSRGASVGDPDGIAGVVGTEGAAADKAEGVGEPEGLEFHRML